MSAPVTGRRRRGRVPLVVVLVGLLMTMPMAAWGAWSSQTTLGTTASTGVVQTPTGLQCADVGDGFLQTAAHISWTPVTGATRYAVLLDDGDDVTELLVTDASITISRTLLGNLIGGLLDLLLGGGTVQVSVATLDGSGWRSPPSAEPEVITGGFLGIYCDD